MDIQGQKLQKSANKKVTVTLKKTDGVKENSSKVKSDDSSGVEISDSQKKTSENNELIEYLKSIIGLEIAIKNNNEEIETFHKTKDEKIDYNPPRKPEYNPPARNIAKHSTSKKSSRVDVVFTIVLKGVLGAGLIFLLSPFFILLAFLPFGYTLDDDFEALVMVTVWIVIVIVFFLVYTYKSLERVRLREQENQRTYQAEIKKEEEQYQEQCKKSKEEFDIKIQEYQVLYDNYQEEYESSKRNAQESRKRKLQEFNDKSQQLSAELAEIYSKNILHEKYRNIEAVTAIYNYLSTSRCQTLEGRDGAYNLYEEEKTKQKTDEQIKELEAVIANLQKDLQNERELNYSGSSENFV